MKVNIDRDTGQNMCLVVKKMVCCVTGHRSGGFPFSREEYALKYLVYMEQMRKQLLSLICEGYCSFYTGMAEGADLDFAKNILDLRDREEYDITLTAALPYPVRPVVLETEYQKMRDEILFSCDRVDVVSPQYHRGCMQKRNQYMVDRSDLVLAIWNGKQAGGTWNTIRYARSLGKEIRYIMLDEIGEELLHVPAWNDI